MYGGVEQFGWRLAQELARRGHAVEIVCGRRETDPPEGVGVVLVGRGGLTKFSKILWFLLAAERVRRERRHDVTIGLGKTLRQDLLRKSGGPERTFWELHRRMYPPLILPLKRIKRALFEPQRPLKDWIERRQLRHARIVVTVSGLCRNWLLARYPWLADKLLVVYNKPDLARFAPLSPDQRQEERRKWGIAPDQKAVLLAGTNFRLKGLPACIEALARLPEEYVLLVAGGGQTGAFQRQARRLAVADRLRFLGKVDRMDGLYGAADVLAQPTLYDTCSNVVLEALASGLPVVASADDGSSFFVAPDFVLRDPMDAADLASKIVKAAASHPLEPLLWPDGLASGLEPYVELVERLLADKERV